MEREKLRKLIDSYKSKNPETYLYGQERGNCGVIASDFMLYCERVGVDAPRICGAFIIDHPKFDKLDFTEEEIQDLKDQGYDFDSIDERIKYIEDNNLMTSHKYIPHYWNVIDGEIVDLSGESQFIDTGLSETISPDRYIKGDFEEILEKAPKQCTNEQNKKSNIRKRGL